MKKISFNILGKKVTVEATGNPNYFRVIIDTANTYRVYRLPAVSISSAMYHAQSEALGVR